jgi:hypothetical protein
VRQRLVAKVACDLVIAADRLEEVVGRVGAFGLVGLLAREGGAQ